MPRSPRIITSFALFVVLLLAACGGSSATSTPSATTAPTKAPTTAAASVQATVVPTTAAASAQATTRAPSAAAPASTAAPTAASTAAPAATTAASSATTGTVTAASGTLTVFAAASLTESFTEIKATFEKANPSVTVTYNFAGSQALVTQMTQGAPADVFASADQPNMDNAIKGGVIAGTPQIFVKNKLVIIVPKDNKAGIATPKDLAKPGIKFDTAQASVPVGTYTQQALDNFSKLPEYGADFKANVNKNTVSQEDNVKAIVQKVQLGEADAGIVYATDAQAAKDKLTLIDIPDAQNVIATYPVAVVKGAKQAALGQKFIAYLLSADGQAILQKYGFAPGM
ncbi:MAG TPA: molybdate ABC transporter substrate-binding protein [Thermomicrobiales bacterium]|jgi:molybdate transport system substrate-binding protein